MKKLSSFPILALTVSALLLASWLSLSAQTGPAMTSPDMEATAPMAASAGGGMATPAPAMGTSAPMMTPAPAMGSPAMASGMAATMSAPAKTPPAVGSVAPDFTLMGLDGKPVEFRQLTAKKTVVLVVLRGWPGYNCPFCTMQVHDYVANAADLAKQDVQVLMVYPGPADKLKDHAEAFLKDKNWPKDFLFVLDPDYAFTNAYGLRWNAPSETAYPSTFIVDGKNKILFEQISKAHGGRVQAATVLGELDKLKSATTAAMSTPAPMMTPAPSTGMSAPMATPPPAMSTPAPMTPPASGMNAQAPMAPSTAAP